MSRWRWPSLAGLSTANLKTRMPGTSLHPGRPEAGPGCPSMTQITKASAVKAASALHQHRARALRPLAFAHDAEPLGDLGIGLHQPAEIAAEAVLVELLVRLDVPQAARVGGDLVGDDDSHHVVLPQPAGLHLEVDETNADAEEKPGEEIVDADGERHDVVDLLRRGPAEGGDVLFRHHRVVELVVLVIEFDDRARQLRAFFKTETSSQRAGGDVAHHDLKRNDLDLAN